MPDTFPIQNTQVGKPRRYPKRAGNTIAEYGLIGVGILVATTWTLVFLGNNMNGLMQQFQVQAKNQAQMAVSANTQHQSARNSFAEAQASHILSGTAAWEGAQTSAESSVTQTAGVNGSTDNYSQDIVDAAKDHLTSGSISQEQYNLMVQMANQGHEMAAIEAALSKAFDRSTSADDYMSLYVKYKGKPYTVSQLLGMLQSSENNFRSLSSSMGNASSANSSLLSIVGSASNRIQSISRAIQQANSALDADELMQAYGNNSSGGTHQEAAAICTAGQHMDVNNHCVAN